MAIDAGVCRESMSAARYMILGKPTEDFVIDEVSEVDAVGSTLLTADVAMGVVVLADPAGRQRIDSETEWVSKASGNVIASKRRDNMGLLWSAPDGG